MLIYFYLIEIQKSAPKDYTIGRLRASLNEVELRAKLFELFHEKEYWKFGELVEATDQPRVDIS